MKAKDLTGNKIGKLLLTERKRENNRTYYYCKCDCGNSLWIRADSLTKSNPTQSCGCLSEDTQFKAKDIRNKRYGRLVAVKPTKKRDKYNSSVIWKCECDCGNIKYAPEYLLNKGGVSSCGCLGMENSLKNIAKATEVHLKEHIIEGTNIQVIATDKPMAHNTSGVKGVKWDKEREKWIAEIIFQKQHYYLGRYDNKEDAVKARKEAEDKLHKEFLKNMKK